MELHDLYEAMLTKGVHSTCPACDSDSGIAGSFRADLGAEGSGRQRFIGAYCANCGHLRLFHEGTLETPES